MECEVYPMCLRERLPAIRVPLRPTDADVVLDLQPLIDQCHERGRYHLLDYRHHETLRQRRFHPIELLVVIAIIAILVGMLLPALKERNT